MAQQSILLVDDDLHHARILEVSLRNAGFSITTARDGAEAMVKIEAIHPALIIAAAALPVMDGLTLCARIKQHPAMNTLPIFLIMEAGADPTAGRAAGADEILTRPIFTQELLTQIKLLLQRRSRQALERPDEARFFGRLSELSVVDLLQLISGWRRGGVVTIESGQLLGRLAFDEGAIIDAAMNHRKGAEAIYRMLTWQEGTFEIDFKAAKHPTKLHTPIQELIFEGMRRADEWSRMCEQLPPLSVAFQVDFSELAERLSELPPEVNALLKLFDGRHDALSVIDESELDDLEALAALSRLYFEGILYEQSQQAALPPPAEEDALDDWLPDAPLGAEEPLRVEPVDFQLSDEDLGLRPAPASGAPPRDLMDDLLASATGVVAPDETGAFVLDDGFSLPDDDQLLFDPDALEAPIAPAAKPAAKPAAVAEISEAAIDEDPLGFGDMGALPSTSNIVQGASEASFFERSLEEIEAMEDHLDHEPISRIALFTFGALGALVIAGVLFFALQDTVTPRASELPPLNHDWHTQILKQRVLPKEIAPIDAPWQTPEGATAPRAADEAEASPEAAPLTEAPPPAPPPPEVDAAALDALIAEGKQLQEKGRYRDAIARFEEALGVAPNSERALLPLASALLEDGHDERALQMAVKAAEVNAASAQAQLIMGSARQNLGQKEAAIEAYERYLKLAPSGAFATDVRQVLKGMR